MYFNAYNIPYTFCEQIGGEIRDISDEVPFEIPESWEWVRLGNIVNAVSARRVHQSDWKARGIPFFRAREIAKLAEYGFVDNELFISEELFEEYSKSGVPQAGDLMITAVGTLGKTYIVNDNDRFYYKDASVICLENYSKLNSNYLKYLIMSSYMEMVIKESSSGTTVGTITLVRANEYLIPLPPLSEQHRIVAKIEELLPYIEKYEQAETQLTELNSTFPELLKKSILQEAVQGKLVPQDPNDEPASVLLEHIRKEKQELIKAGKIKKDKHESAIVTLDKIPYILPDDWIWVRLGFISTYDEKKQKINAQNADLTQWLLDLEDIERGGRLLVKKTVAERKAVGDKTIFNKGDILYSKLRPYLLKILVASDDGICTPEIVPFTMYGKILAEYVVYYLKSPYVDSAVNDETYGIKMPRAGTETMINLPFPLPPIEEQHRIVKKIEELMPIINTLSK